MHLIKYAYLFTFLFIFNLFSTQLMLAEDKLVYVHSQAFSQIKIHPIKKAPAQVIALATASLSSEISSIVDQVNVYAGDKVEKGKILVELNCDDFRSKLTELSALKEEIESALVLKKYQLGRSKKLFKSKNISEVELKKDQSEVKILYAKLKFIQVKEQLAKKNVSRCQIKSPYSGVILQRLISQGEMVTIGQSLLTITDPNQSEVEVQLPIGLVDNIVASHRYFVSRGKKYPVLLRAIIPSIETRARHQQYRFSFTKDVADKPIINAYGELQVTLADSFLPAKLLVIRDKISGVFLLQNGKASFYPIKDVKPGRAFAVNLEDTTEVITEGFNGLRDGQAVKRLDK